MENATKALLIAAAILIAIILISMGIAVVRQGQEAVQSIDMSEAEILAHNSKFTNYAGSNVSGSEVKVLLGIVLSHNQSAEEGAKVTVSGGTITQNATASSIATVSTTSRYTVECEMANGGIVNNIKISVNN